MGLRPPHSPLLGPPPGYRPPSLRSGRAGSFAAVLRSPEGVSPESPHRRTIVIGDLHGCHDEALELLDKCAVGSNDRVIFAGDLVDRGPKRRECVELAMKHEAVLGNHEESHLQQRKRSLDKLKPDHAETRRVLEDHHFEWMKTLPPFIGIPEANAVVVHAGVFPGLPIDRQPTHLLLHGQTLNPPDVKSYWPSKAPPGWSFWTNHWKGPERVIFGHTVLDRPLVSRWAVGIDTGCVHGLALTAVVLPEWEIVQVPARRNHFGPRGEGIAKYPVMDGVLAFS